MTDRLRQITTRPAPDVMTVAEASRLIGPAPDTIKKGIRSGAFPGVTGHQRHNVRSRSHETAL